jgi:hypothetical protein
LQAKQSHPVAAGIQARLEMQGSLNSGERLHHSILQPTGSRKTEPQPIRLPHQTVVTGFR